MTLADSDRGAVKLAVSLLATVVIVSVLVVSVQASFEQSGSYNTIVKEEFNPSSATLHVFNESQRKDVVYNDTVTVTDKTGASEATPENYTWISSNGTLAINTSSDFQNETSANITYGYFRTTRRKLIAQQMIATIPKLIGPMLLFGFVVVIILALRGG